MFQLGDRGPLLWILRCVCFVRPPPLLLLPQPSRYRGEKTLKKRYSPLIFHETDLKLTDLSITLIVIGAVACAASVLISIVKLCLKKKNASPVVLSCETKPISTSAVQYV